VLTSSITKFEHIRFLCSLNGVVANRIPCEYPEAQEDEMEAQLRFATNAVRKKLPYPEAFYIIEQTAVYFDSYGPRSKRPGFYFKHWWRSKKMSEFKHLASSDPRARIESGVALLISQHDPILFLNQQRGHISFEGSIRAENKKYPWLSSEDFNLYFVPEGTNFVYNSMTLPAFLKHDFRRPNIEKVCERLSEYEAILKSNISLRTIQEVGTKHSRSEEQAKLHLA